MLMWHLLCPRNPFRFWWCYGDPARCVEGKQAQYHSQVAMKVTASRWRTLLLNFTHLVLWIRAMLLNARHITKGVFGWIWQVFTLPISCLLVWIFFDSFSLPLTQPENIFKTRYRDRITSCMIRFIPESQRASSFFLEHLVLSEYLFNIFIHG